MLDEKSILIEAENKNYCVILCHGIRADKEEHGNFKKLSQKLLESGISSYRFDFTGHGQSQKNFSDLTISVAIKDLESAIQYVTKLGYQKIVILGASFGAGIASLVNYSKFPNVVALVLWYPVLIYSDAQIFSEENVKKAIKNGYMETKSIKTGNVYHFSKKLMLETLEYSPYNSLLNSNLPALLIHGDKDSVVPFDTAKKLTMEDKKLELLPIKDGEHGFFDKEEHLNQAIDYTICYIKRMEKSEKFS